MEEIDNKEIELESKPKEFSTYYKEVISEMKQYIGLIEGEKNNVMGKAKEEKNKLYDNDLISTLDAIRRAQGKQQVNVEFNLAENPKEKTYGETQKNIETKMADLFQEGREFFRGKKSTFEFFKNVVEKKGNIDWHDSVIEKQELEAMNLIKTEVVVL